MSKPQGIIVFGANGSGKTTLGRELARLLGYRHMDHEDYHFIPSEIPYTQARPWEECLRLMLSDIEKHPRFVLSAVIGDFGDVIPTFYRLGVHISAPPELRLERIKQREHDRHKDRIAPGGDMFEQHQRFLSFVSTRSTEPIEKWAAALACPVLRVDGAKDFRQTAVTIADIFNATEK